jgi:hypothetical protein
LRCFKVYVHSLKMSENSGVISKVLHLKKKIVKWGIILWVMFVAQLLYNFCTTLILFYFYDQSLDLFSGIWFLYNTNTTTVQQPLTWLTLMWGVVVQLLYWCCKSNIFLVFLYVGHNIQWLILKKMLLEL